MRQIDITHTYHTRIQWTSSSFGSMKLWFYMHEQKSWWNSIWIWIIFMMNNFSELVIICWLRFSHSDFTKIITFMICLLCLSMVEWAEHSSCFNSWKSWTNVWLHEFIFNASLVEGRMWFEWLRVIFGVVSWVFILILFVFISLIIHSLHSLKDEVELLQLTKKNTKKFNEFPPLIITLLLNLARKWNHIDTRNVRSCWLCFIKHATGFSLNWLFYFKLVWQGFNLFLPYYKNVPKVAQNPHKKRFVKFMFFF